MYMVVSFLENPMHIFTLHKKKKKKENVLHVYIDMVLTLDPNNY